jgi:arginyl-tRNA synthetase
MRDLVEAIRPLLKAVMSDLDVGEEDWSGLLAGSTVSDFADVAMPCHSLARVLRQSPAAIAEDVLAGLGSSTAGICTVSSVNGFLNFTADNEWLSMRMEEASADERLRVAVEDSRIIVIDYSSPNVAKHMHVGHLRSTVIGDALNRMLTYKGHTVVPENHVGDWGTPFGMLIEHLIDIGVETPPDEIDKMLDEHTEWRAPITNVVLGYDCMSLVGKHAIQCITDDCGSEVPNMHVLRDIW